MDGAKREQLTTVKKEIRDNAAAVDRRGGTVRPVFKLPLAGNNERPALDELTLTGRDANQMVRPCQLGQDQPLTWRFGYICWSGRWLSSAWGSAGSGVLQDRLPDFSPG